MVTFKSMVTVHPKDLGGHLEACGEIEKKTHACDNSKTSASALSEANDFH